MNTLWDYLSKGLREGLAVLAEKTDEYTKIGRIKLEIISIKRDIEKLFTELGGKVYHLMVEQNDTNIASNEEIRGLIEKVKDLERRLQEKRQEIEKVKKAKERKTAATS